MFIPYIATFILLLISFAYMATSGSVSDAAETRINFAKVKFIYPKEKVIISGVEHLCQADGAFCKDKEVDGVITLQMSDLVGYIPDSFTTSNGLGGVFSNDILIQNNYTTITIEQNIDKNSARYIYLHYYAGAENGIYPTCVSGIADQNSPCDTTSVLHDYPSSINLRTSIENS